VIVNVCPAATTKASPDAVWNVVEATDRYSEWTGGARVVSVEPSGSARAGQVIRFAGRALGRTWTFTIDIRSVDPQRRWIDLVARFPFGIVNYEHLTLTETKDGGTLVRFN
jgi:ligand-binding SRPBCC domain-containing protein